VQKLGEQQASLFVKCISAAGSHGTVGFFRVKGHYQGRAEEQVPGAGCPKGSGQGTGYREQK